MLRFSTLFVLILFAELAQARPIVGGVPVTAVDPVARTTVALIAVSSRGQSLCTASIVAPDLAVTAAHCVTSLSGEAQRFVLVFARDVRSASPGEMRTIDRVEVPGEWRPEHSGGRDTSDVALAHFQGGLVRGYEAAGLLPYDRKPHAGDPVILAGYGIEEAEPALGAGTLRKVEVSVTRPDYSPSEIELDQSHGGGACHGDSGGPAWLMVEGRPYLFGITSRGSGNCDREVIYTWMGAYDAWFREAAKRLRQ